MFIKKAEIELSEQNLLFTLLFETVQPLDGPLEGRKRSNITVSFNNTEQNIKTNTMKCNRHAMHIT